jgi:Queuosine biosynthesis protein
LSKNPFTFSLTQRAERLIPLSPPDPRSSFLLLMAAFAGKEFTLGAYRGLVRAKYRFDLFGDGMLIL